MTFPPLAPEDDATLHWRQPSALHYRYTLQAADRELGRLDYPSSLRSRAVAETAAGLWTFEPEGFWQPRIVVLQNAQPIASLEISAVWLRNRAVLVSDRAEVIAEWEMTSYLKGLVEWRDANGETLIRYRSGTDEGGVASWIRFQCRVDFTPAGFAHPHRDLLLCLGWHMTTLATAAAA